jgi:amino acid transporter
MCASVHPSYRTPHVAIILMGIVFATLDGLPVEEIVNLGNSLALFAFVLVARRRADPARHRAEPGSTVPSARAWLTAPLAIATAYS